MACSCRSTTRFLTIGLSTGFQSYITWNRRLDRIERHDEKYSESGKIIASAAVSGLLK